MRQGLLHQQLQLQPLPNQACLERLAVTLFTKGKRKIHLLNIYRPPARNARDDGRDASLHLDTWPTSPDHLVFADINGHGTWDEKHDGDDIGTQLDEWLIDNNWSAFNNGRPTYTSHAGVGSAPDVTLGHSSWTNRITWRIGEALGSDHRPIFITIDCDTTGRAKREPAWWN